MFPGDRVPTPDAGAAEQYLVADIGASNARFSLAADGLVGERLLLATRAFADVAELLGRVRAEFAPTGFTAACLAVAGPVAEGRGRITNGSLEFDAAEAAAQLGCPVLLVNDFFALARSLPALSELRDLGAGSADPGGVRAVLGPGSGLGMGALLPRVDGWRVLPSEGGHADLAPSSPLECEILQILQAEHGHVSWETVLSGPGLRRLYHAVCTLWGSKPQDPASPEWIAASGVAADEPVCHQTLEIFCGLLGAAAGNLALTVYATGGVYLGGGILPQLADFVAASPLRRRFDERGPMTSLVRGIPLRLIIDPAPGLTGALACLLDARGAAAQHR